MKVYKQKEIQEIRLLIEKAKKIWMEASKAEFDKTGDRGSCVVSDGIFVFWTPPRCKKPQKLMIIHSRDVAFAQGSLHYEATKDKALMFLKNLGVDAYYDYGRMD
jgi:hypothetical protein